MKLKNVQSYPIKDVPDHLVQECFDLGRDLCKVILQNSVDKNPNIILGAIAFMHAALLKHFISDNRDEIESAAKLTAIALLKNVDLLIDLQEKNNDYPRS